MGERACGILLHPTSLPAVASDATLGRPARRWLDWLEEAGQSLWQILPLGPPDAAGSPYAALSAFAGDPRLIDLEPLAAVGLLRDESAGPTADRRRAIGEAHARLVRRGDRDPLALASADWAAAPEQQGWLEDWALFAALKRHHAGASWIDWPPPLRDRQPAGLAAAREELAESIALERFTQFLFWSQWSELKRDANRRGIRILGDLPIYAALDSADVWAHRDLFDLDAAGRPRSVAGVPPDAFSDTGQLWGHPLYRWDRMRDTGYAWWVRRVDAACRAADAVRVDHFRAYVAFWQVPAGHGDAARGRWVEGPGRAPFDAAAEALGSCDLIAEDLGLIDAAVLSLRDELGLPGMAVLQFGFANEHLDSEHLPHRYRPHLVAYTGTHDNDTCRGWYATLDPATRERVDRYLAPARGAIHLSMIGSVWTSVAERVVAPLQDVLGLGSEARLNTPGRAAGNWRWRCDPARLTGEVAADLRRVTEESGRAPAAVGPAGSAP